MSNGSLGNFSAPKTSVSKRAASKGDAAAPIANYQHANNRSTEPIVELINHFDQPYNNSVATARTCYSSRIVLPTEVAETQERREQRDRIAASIYKAGHHTTLQHSTFQFILDRVSRHFIWSFLHAHQFYNSEQVSQRYVEVKPGKFYIPQLNDKARKIYLETVEAQMNAYQKLIEILLQPVQKNYQKIFPRRNIDDKRWRRAMKKRSMEVARYVLPVATFAHLYHTISGLTLHRYHRLCQQMDVPTETARVVQKMVEEITKIDPDFCANLEDTLPLEDTLEYQALADFSESPQKDSSITEKFLNEFDASLKGKTSVLVGFPAESVQNMVNAVRSVLGLPKQSLSDDDALRLLFDPARNRYLSEALNLNSLGKLTRSLHHCHFTFRKKLSHTADSQDQRHRQTPGSRPVLSRHFLPHRPDYIIPPLVAESPEALDLYEATMERTWSGIRSLFEEGVSQEEALYLLPNSFPIRFEESGDLMGFHHKWTSRLCYTAQEEIWNSCRDEVLQVSQAFPDLGKWLHPPCTLRKMAKETPFCPEGDRFCGVRVWKMDVEDFDRLL